MALAGFNGEIKGIDCKIAATKKYILAYLLNCKIKDRGKKVNMLYFVVEM